MLSVTSEMGVALSVTDFRLSRRRHADTDPTPILEQAIAVNSNTNATRPELSVIIPTRNEHANVGALLERLVAALGGIPAEIVFVDDSDDDTPDEIERVAQDMRLPVRVLHRDPGQREGGLGTAVVSGMKVARSPWALVMDADLQHPPEVVPQLYVTGRRQDVDLVVASRYAGHGNSGGLDGAARRNSSRFATRIAKLTFPRRASRVSDPMSGFFLVRIAALDLDRLRPHGYKILLELIVRCARLRTAEVSFSFAPRHAGESKTSLREMARFGRHLVRLRLQIARERSSAAEGVPRLRSRLVLFGLVGVSGILVNSLALWALHFRVLQVHYLVAAFIATQVSTLWNFVLTDRLVFRSAGRSGSWG